jgi:adenylate cyclase, class 2
MDTEFEVRFLDIDTDAVRDKLPAQGGACVRPRTLMRRNIFKNKDIAERGGWLRLRDEGRRITMLEAIGFGALRYQENYREEWKLGEVTLDIDTWPGLATYVEIEGPSERRAGHRRTARIRLQPGQLRQRRRGVLGSPRSRHPRGRDAHLRDVS